MSKYQEYLELLRVVTADELRKENETLRRRVDELTRQLEYCRERHQERNRGGPS